MGACAVVAFCAVHAAPGKHLGPIPASVVFNALRAEVAVIRHFVIAAIRAVVDFCRGWFANRLIVHCITVENVKD
jgi:hypothetical protein